MSLLSACEWLASTYWSTTLRESQYGYSLVESVHVWTLCLFVGFAVILDLRLLGAVLRRTPASEVTRRLQPWMVAGFSIMVATGALLFFAIPVRSYQNVFFRLKVVLLVLAGLNVWVFHSGIYTRIERWDTDARPPRAARRAAVMSLALWAAIILSGRMIAYNWFDCGKPQSDLVKMLAGCGAYVDPYAAPELP